MPHHITRREPRILETHAPLSTSTGDIAGLARYAFAMHWASALVVLTTAAICHPITGQVAGGGAAGPAGEVAPPQVVPLVLPPASPGQEWVLLDPLGAAFEVPRGTRVIHRPDGANPHLLLRDGAAKPMWSLRAEIIASPEGSMNPAADVMLGPDALGTSDTRTILNSTSRTIEGRDASETWVTEALSDGAHVAFGWLAVPRSDGQVMLFTAVTTPALLPMARPAIERVFASVVPMDTPEALAAAEAAIERGERILEGIDPATLEALIGLRRVLRIWRHAPNGQPQELGFGTLTVKTAPMNQVRPNDGLEAAPSDQQIGLLVTLHLRYAIDPLADKYLDQVARMWMRWDGQEERWYLNSTRKQRGLQAKETEFGIRTAPSVGQPRPRLIIIRQDDDGMRAPFENEVPNGWLPRPLEWLMADLAPRTEDEIVAWPAWDRGSITPRMLMRRDRWNENPDGSWVLSTWEGMDALPSYTLVTRQGPVSTSKPDGTRIELSSDEAIASLWQAAGLRIQ